MIIAAARLALLALLLGDDLKARKLGDPKGGRYRDVHSVATPSHDNAPDAGMIVARVCGVPTAIEKDFGPGAEIHGIGIKRNADVAQIASAIPRGNVHASAERYGEMREVAAYTHAFMHGIAGAAGGARIRITEPDRRVHEIANRVHALAAANIIPKVNQAKSASLSLSQYLLCSRNSSTSSGRSAIGVISVSGGVSSGSPEFVNDEAIGE